MLAGFDSGSKYLLGKECPTNRFFPILAALLAAGCSTQATAPVSWVTVPSAAQHENFFPVGAGPHAIDCNSCHGAADSFRGFDCISCHTQPKTDPRHAGIAGYVWASASCYACHPQGTGISPADHAKFYPVTTADSHAFGKTVTVGGAAVTITCTSCHTDPANRPNVDCTGCHLQNGSSGTPGPALPADQATAHSGKVGTTAVNGAPHNLWAGTGPVGNGTGATARCLQCHGNDSRPAGFVAVHGQAGPAKAVFVIDPKNFGHFVSCDQCHTATLTAPNLKNPEFDFAQASCDACHLAAGANDVMTTHQGFGFPISSPYAAGDKNNSTACLSCHPNGEFAANFDHAWFPIKTADAHGSSVAKCADCHSTPASYQGPAANNLSLITCTRCHDDSAANQGNQKGLTITQVHSAGKVGKDIWDVPGGLDYTNNALCLKCHAGNISGNVAAFSTPLVFRMAQHDAHCSLSGKNLISGDATHNVNRNSDATNVNICFACHNALSTGSTPWATDWTVASPTTSCIACHKHRTDTAPNVICR